MRKPGLLLLCAMILGAAVLNAQPEMSSGAQLVVRSGVVEVQRNNVWQPVALGESLNPGERIRTGSGSMAAIGIGPDKVITIRELSQVRIRHANPSPVVELESGTMKVVSASDIQLAARDTTLESGGRPLDMEMSYQSDKLNVTVLNGSVITGPVIIRGAADDPGVRTYSASGLSEERDRAVQTYESVHPAPIYYVYPYYSVGPRDPNVGRIVPPRVINPTNPGYQPSQVVPPMSDPIRVPVTPVVPPAGTRPRSPFTPQ